MIDDVAANSLFLNCLWNQRGTLLFHIPICSQNDWTSSLAFFEEWFATRYGETRNIEVVTQDFEAACRLVVGTNRITTVLSRMAKLCAEHLPLRQVHPPFAIPKVTQCLQWHRYQDQDPGHIWLRYLLKETANKLQMQGKNGKTVRPWSLASELESIEINIPASALALGIGLHVIGS